MRIVAFRHAISDGMGSFSSALEKAGCSFHYIDTYREDISGFNAEEPELLIVLGGAPGVYQADDYSFIRDEIAVLEKRLAKDLPTLGICLGAQMMAAALGARVYYGANGIERGWHPVAVNPAGMETPLRHLDGAVTPVPHWHNDTFDMPQGATLLASSAAYAHQAFSFGRNCLALQFHPEATPSILKGWCVMSARCVAEGTIDLARIRADTDAHGEKLIGQTEKFITEWIAGVRKNREAA
jgi:GMP synthase (glutamine-hydrolysing)